MSMTHSFSEAIDASMKDGKRIRRSCWNDGFSLIVHWATATFFYVGEDGKETRIETVSEEERFFSISDIKDEDWEILDN